MGEAIIVGVILLTIAFVLRQPRPRAFLHRHLPTVVGWLGTPRPSADTASPIEKWDAEMAQFRDDASAVWAFLIEKFEHGGFFGLGSSRDGFRGIVSGAPWPDDQGDRDDATSLCEEALVDFCKKAYAKSGERVFDDTREFLEFDAAHRRMTEALREWAGRREIKGFLDWLRDKLDWPRRGPTSPIPDHARTVKLAWYLELAVASESGNETADYNFLPALRDALSASLPVIPGVNDDGYLIEIEQGILGDLEKLAGRLTGLPHLIAYRLGGLNKELRNWVADHYERYPDPGDNPELRARLEQWRNLSEEEISEVQSFGQTTWKGAFDVKKYSTPYLDAHIGEIQSLPKDFRQAVIEIKEDLSLFNQRVDTARKLLDRSLDSSLSPENHQIVVRNLNETYARLQDDAVRIVERIDKLPPP